MTWVLAGEHVVRYTHQCMINHPTLTQRAEAEQALSSTQFQKICLGIDWHADQYRVVRIIDNGGPEPAQRFTPEEFLKWAKKQTRLAWQVYSCYEAGAGGYYLHRQLLAEEVLNYVVAPRKLDRQNKGVVTDKTDARELAYDLSRYVNGHTKALCVVRAPTPEQEQARCESRQREQLKEHLQSMAAQGRSLLLTQGYRRKGRWWKLKEWEYFLAHFNPPAWLVERLELWRSLIVQIDEKLDALTCRIEAAAPTVLPVGLGKLTFENVRREVLQWDRFHNRKGPGSYAGLVGGVSASGPYHRDLSLTKAGNGRLRSTLVEAAWRMLFYQPKSKLVQKHAKVLFNPKAGRAARKRMIVAMARQLFIDLWRWQTGQVSPKELGWQMMQPMLPS